jgi:hypothetical protein
LLRSLSTSAIWCEEKALRATCAITVPEHDHVDGEPERAELVFLVIFAQRLEKVKISRFENWRVRKVYFLHVRSVGADGQRNRFNAMQKPLRGSKCENMDDVTSFCTEILASAQLSCFEGLGENSRDQFRRLGLGNSSEKCILEKLKKF